MKTSGHGADSDDAWGASHELLGHKAENDRGWHYEATEHRKMDKPNLVRFAAICAELESSLHMLDLCSEDTVWYFQEQGWRKHCKADMRLMWGRGWYKTASEEQILLAHHGLGCRETDQKLFNLCTQSASSWRSTPLTTRTTTRTMDKDRQIQ